MSKALLVTAHGSRREASNIEVQDIARRMEPYLSSQYSIVQHAFLEIAAPSIPDGMKACVEQGARQIDVFPYFLANGKHVAKDVPELVHETAKSLEVKTRILPYLGSGNVIAEMASRLILEACET